MKAVDWGFVYKCVDAIINLIATSLQWRRRCIYQGLDEELRV